MGNIFDYWKGMNRIGNDCSIIKNFYPRLFRETRTTGCFVYKGKPAYLYAAADVNISGGSVAESYVFKIEWKTKK